MKEVPKKDEAEVSGGIQSPGGFRGGLVIPNYPVLPYPTDPCIPTHEDPTRQVEK